MTRKSRQIKMISLFKALKIIEVISGKCVIESDLVLITLIVINTELNYVIISCFVP